MQFLLSSLLTTLVPLEDKWQSACGISIVRRSSVSSSKDPPCPGRVIARSARGEGTWNMALPLRRPSSKEHALVLRIMPYQGAQSLSWPSWGGLFSMISFQGVKSVWISVGETYDTNIKGAAIGMTCVQVRGSVALAASTAHKCARGVVTYVDLAGQGVCAQELLNTCVDIECGIRE